MSLEQNGDLKSLEKGCQEFRAQKDQKKQNLALDESGSLLGAEFNHLNMPATYSDVRANLLSFLLSSREAPPSACTDGNGAHLIRLEQPKYLSVSFSGSSIVKVGGDVSDGAISFCPRINIGYLMEANEPALQANARISGLMHKFYRNSQ